MSRSYKVVDVFSSKPLLGNPVAVVLDAHGLSDADMQAIARWTNLSETTFVLPPTKDGADYQLRIFTPGSELPFAGHPTLGSAHALVEAGIAKPRNGKLIQQCKAGLIELTVSEAYSFILPPSKILPVADSDLSELEAILGATLLESAKPMIVDVGAVWCVAQIKDVHALLALQPDFARSNSFEQRLGLTGITVFARTGAGHNLEVRSFAPSCGVNEDPVCGSGNGSVAAFLSHHGMVPATGLEYEAGQGQCVGRDGKISVTITKEHQIHVGGRCRTTVNGTLSC